MAEPEPAPLGGGAACLLAALAVGSFHLARVSTHGAFASILYLAALYHLTNVHSVRIAFYTALGVGVACYGPALAFFWALFGAPAAVLWLILAFWTALFVLLIRAARRWRGTRTAALWAPVVWLATEFFRSELYPLRFSWLTAGSLFAAAPGLQPALAVGVYGIGFLAMSAASLASLLPPRWRLVLSASGLLVLAGAGTLEGGFAPPFETGRVARVAGVQLEFPSELDVLKALDALKARHPRADLLVLSEYTFDGPPPTRVMLWCKRNQRHLVVGGKEPLGTTNFYNTAFVIGPQGQVVFRQAKSVPIQFFKDGLPAPAQAVWDSPWGKLGVCICYDLSYARVVDELIRQGAQALVVPMMDVEDWGAAQHELHSRVPPLRAAEYRVPIFRVASSGISQLVDADGQVQASAGFPGQGEILAGDLRLVDRGRIPPDRWAGLGAVGLTVWLMLALVVTRADERLQVQFQLKRPTFGRLN